MSTPNRIHSFTTSWLLYLLHVDFRCHYGNFAIAVGLAVVLGGVFHSVIADISINIQTVTLRIGWGKIRDKTSQWRRRRSVGVMKV